MCNQITFIINSGLIPGGQHLNNRQTVFFLLVDPRDKRHKVPDDIDMNVPRHAQYLHNAWKRHQDAVYWVDIDLGITEGFVFYQTRSNAIILHETLPAYCIPKVVRMETGEVMYEKVYMSPRPPPKISLKHDWKRELGSAHAQRPEGQVVQQSVKSIPPTTENWLRKRYNYSINNDTSNEDKHKTNYSINDKCNDMNTRNMHIT